MGTNSLYYSRTIVPDLLSYLVKILIFQLIRTAGCASCVGNGTTMAEFVLTAEKIVKKWKYCLRHRAIFPLRMVPPDTVYAMCHIQQLLTNQVPK